MDNRILEKRLLYRESGPVPSVNKCAKSFSDMLFATSSSRERSIDGFIRDVKAYEFDMQKVLGSIKLSEEELAELVVEESQIQQEKTILQQSIIDLNLELTQQHQIMLVKGECEVLAAKVNKLPSKSMLKRQIEESEGNLRATREGIVEVEDKISKRLRLLEDIAAILRRLTVELPAEEKSTEAPQAAEESDEDERRDDEPGGDGFGARIEEPEDNEEDGEVADMDLVQDADGEDAHS